MAKPNGFLLYKREDNTVIPPEKRMKNWDEFRVPMSEEQRQKQAARCMNCGVPFCQSAMVLNGMVTGCPLHNLIPEWNDEIYRGHPEHALARLLKTSSFPEFTGRVCPALCEKACMNGLDGEPVSIHENELYLIEYAFEHGLMKPRIPAKRSGHTVAVIGSGPSGLAVADRLNQRGHTVTVYERDDEPGGLLMYGIPNMKLDKSVLKRRVQLMEEEGITFITNANIGVDIQPEELYKKFDAVVLACGAKLARGLQAEGMKEVKDGIVYAVDYLTEATKSLQTKPSTSAKGKDIVILGGGDTGNDCTAVSIREGCKSVTQLEMMPEPPEVRTDNNPWPEWPKVKKIDYGQQEAIHEFGKDPRIFETTVKSVKTEDGKLKEIVTVQVKFNQGKLEMVPGTEKTMPCQLLILAAGFVGCEPYISDAFQIKRTERGRIETETNKYQTSRKGVFTAGDMHRGSSLVVWAIAEGRDCAAEVDQYLMGYSSLNEGL